MDKEKEKVGDEIMKFALWGIACGFSLLSALPWIFKMISFYFDYFWWVIKG